MSLRSRISRAVPFAALLLVALHAPVAAQPYPRLGLYGSVTGSGWPFVKADGSLDPVVLDQVARYDEVVLDVNPLTPYRPDVLQGLRQRHPSIKILAYVLGHDIWPAEDADSLNHFPTRYNHLVRDLGGYLYNSVDGQKFPGVAVNLAKRDANGRFTVAEGLADLVDNAVLASGQWDGVFFDVYCHTITWAQTPTAQIDYVRAGYPTLAAFNLAWQAGTDTLADRLRRIAGPSRILVGNCAASAHLGVFNGWMRENFPYQGGGTWYENMLADPHGYFADERDFVAPPHNYLFSAISGGAGSQYSSDNARRVRFGLASASLGEGFGVFGPSDRNVLTAPYHQWWYDEYSVDLATGRSATDLAHTGWLGIATSPAYQMIWAGTSPDACSNPDFETSVSNGWSFGQFAPAAATITRDASTAAVGQASAHVSITAASTVDWHVNLTSAGTLPVTPGVSYSVTFWAKASPPRTLPVVATKQGGGNVASRNVALTDTWQQFQIVLQPTAATNAALEFFMGTQAGDVWFDDVHFQQGATNLYRRDFANGIVLVNPSDTPLQVPLTGSWKRIRGLVDPTTNDGATVTSVTVNPSDALFLISGAPDTTPPAPIVDVRVNP